MVFVRTWGPSLEPQRISDEGGTGGEKKKVPYSTRRRGRGKKRGRGLRGTRPGGRARARGEWGGVRKGNFRSSSKKHRIQKG